MGNSTLRHALGVVPGGAPQLVGGVLFTVRRVRGGVAERLAGGMRLVAPASASPTAQNAGIYLRKNPCSKYPLHTIVASSWGPLYMKGYHGGPALISLPL